MTRILSIDPAAERSISDTGWAYGAFLDDEPLSIIDSGVIHGGFNGFTTNYQFLNQLITDADIVVCEHFVPWEPKADSTPLLIEGVVRYLRPDVVLQSSSGYKTAVPDRVLKVLGMWSTTGHHQDERSAIRHMLMYMKHLPHKPTLIAGWG